MKRYCLTSAMVFTLVAILHAWRFALGLPLQIGAWDVPRAYSGIAAIGAGFLAAWAIRSSRAEPAQRMIYT